MNYFFGIRGPDSVLAADFEEGAAGSSPGLNHPVFGVTPIPADGIWHHGAATFDGCTWKLYLDGAEDDAGREPAGPQRQHPARGARDRLRSDGTTAQGFFDGVVDEARIWSRALNQEEIQNNINLQLTRAAAALMRRGLNHTSGAAVADSIPTAASGTIVGTSYGWVDGAPFNILVNHDPAAPVLVAPSNGATDVARPPSLQATVTDADDNPLTVTYYGRPAGTTGADFTLVVIPDSQYYTSAKNGGTPAMLTAQTQWAVTNRESANVAFVTHLGDVTDTNTTPEWTTPTRR